MQRFGPGDAFVVAVFLLLAGAIALRAIYGGGAGDRGRAGTPIVIGMAYQSDAARPPGDPVAIERPRSASLSELRRTSTPSPAPTPRAAPLLASGYNDAVVALICAAFVGRDCAYAARVAYCESHHVASSRNFVGAGHYGIFQLSGIHIVRWPGFFERWDEQEWNIERAAELNAEQGWTPWQGSIDAIAEGGC